MTKENKGKAAEERSEGGPETEDIPKCCVCRFPLLVAVLQLLLGVAVTVVAFLMAAISPSLLARETPYWAGIIVRPSPPPPPPLSNVLPSMVQTSRCEHEESTEILPSGSEAVCSSVHDASPTCMHACLHVPLSWPV